MNILFDQGTPLPLRHYLVGHTIITAYEQGWATFTNGQLLDAAEQAGYQLLITTDQNLQYQQNLTKRHIAILVLGSTSWPRIQAHIETIRDAIEYIGVGAYQEIPLP